MAALTLPELAEKMRDTGFGMLSSRIGTGALASRPMSSDREVGPERVHRWDCDDEVKASV